MKQTTFTQDLLLILLQRFLIIVIFLFLAKENLSQLILRRDGQAYLYVAQAILSKHPGPFELSSMRAFIGYPLMLSALIPLTNPAFAVYLVQAVSIFFTTLAGPNLFKNEWLNRYWMMGIPAYVLFTSLNMTEAPFFALSFSSIVFFNRMRTASLFFLFCAILTRPQHGIFLACAFLIFFTVRKDWKSVLCLLIVSLLSVSGIFFLNGYIFHDPMITFKAYNVMVQYCEEHPHFLGSLFCLEDARVASYKEIYTMSLIIFTAAGLGLSLLRLKKEFLNFEKTILRIWGALVFVFLIIGGTKWGIDEFHRLALPVFPALLIEFEKFLPRSWRVLSALFFINICFAVFMELLKVAR